LTSTINYLQNIRAHELYSGTLGTFLELNHNDDNNDKYLVYPIHDETLRRAAAWLAHNNPYLRPFADILFSNRRRNVNGPFPMARHLDTDTDAPPINSREIIIPSYNFPDEIFPLYEVDGGIRSG
jgi:hypothetical protein